MKSWAEYLEESSTSLLTEPNVYQYWYVGKNSSTIPDARDRLKNYVWFHFLHTSQKPSLTRLCLFGNDLRNKILKRL